MKKLVSKEDSNSGEFFVENLVEITLVRVLWSLCGFGRFFCIGDS